MKTKEAYAVITKLDGEVVKVAGVYENEKDAIKKMEKIVEEENMRASKNDIKCGYVSNGNSWVKTEPTEIETSDYSSMFNYNINDVVTIDTDDYPALPKKFVEFLKQYEGKPLVVEKKFLSEDGEIGYYYLSYDGEIITINGRPTPFIDADLKPFRAPCFKISVNEERYELTAYIDNLNKEIVVELLGIDTEIEKKVKFFEFGTNKIDKILTSVEEDEAGLYYYIGFLDRKGSRIGTVQFKINDEGVFVDIFKEDEKSVIESFFIEKE